MYSGPDRGYERHPYGVNIACLVDGITPWQSRFRRQLDPSRSGHSQDGNLFFDIFDTDGFLGDMLLVNSAYYPVMEVLPRRYRFRILNAWMARFIKLVLRTLDSAPARRSIPLHCQ